MKSMWPPLAAIFFMTGLYRAGGAMAPSAPPLDSLLVCMLPAAQYMKSKLEKHLSRIKQTSLKIFHGFVTIWKKTATIGEVMAQNLRLKPLFICCASLKR